MRGARKSQNRARRKTLNEKQRRGAQRDRSLQSFSKRQHYLAYNGLTRFPLKREGGGKTTSTNAEKNLDDALCGCVERILESAPNTRWILFI